jgi:hypothetical protein
MGFGSQSAGQGRPVPASQPELELVLVDVEPVVLVEVVVVVVVVLLVPVEPAWPSPAQLELGQVESTSGAQSATTPPPTRTLTAVPQGLRASRA